MAKPPRPSAPALRCRLTVGRMLIFVACLAVASAAIRQDALVGLDLGLLLTLGFFRAFAIADALRAAGHSYDGGMIRVMWESLAVALVINTLALFAFSVCVFGVVLLEIAGLPVGRVWDTIGMLGGLVAALAVAVAVHVLSFPRIPARVPRGAEEGRDPGSPG